MNKKSLIFVLLVISIFINGCTSKVLLPYEECPECDVGKGEGYFGSVADVYEYTKKEKP